MGKALIFDGITVTDPLDTITILTPDADAERIASYFSEPGSSTYSALNMLVSSLKSAGAWSKMKYIMLPIIASSVDEASQNVLLSTDRTPTTTNLSFANGKLFASEKVYLTDKLGMETYNPCSMGWYIDTENSPYQDGASSQTVLVIGVNRLTRQTTNNAEIFPMNVKGSSDTTSVNDLTTFSSVSTYVEDGNLKVAKITNDSENATVSVLFNDATFGNNFEDGLRLSANSTATGTYLRSYTGGYKIIWVSELLTTLQLESVHKAFKSFVDTLENASE